MDKKELLKYCHYYKGGEKCDNPDPNAQMCWQCEKWWVEKSLSLYNGGEIPSFGYMLDDYIRAGLRQFEEYDNVPATLKAVLYNRYCQYNDRVDIPGFKKFYLEQYHK